MIRTRVRKILRDVWARKGRTLLTSLAIFIGVAGTIALFSMSDILISQLQEDIKEDELAMLEAFVTINADETPDNTRYLQEMRNLSGITEVIGGTESLGYFVIEEPEDEEVEFEVANLYAYATADNLSTTIAEIPIEPGRLIDGNFPTVGAKELAIEQRMAEKYDLSIGDTLYMRVVSPNEAGEAGTVEAWTITGIVFHAYAQGPEEGIYTYVEQSNYLAGESGFNVFKARFVDFGTAEDQEDTFVDYVADQTPYVTVFKFVEDPANNELVTSTQTLTGTMQFLALVALIVSGFLVINVITSIVVEQKRQIGVMKSMGASRSDNFFMYSGIAFAYGVIAVIPGLIIGIWGGNAIAHLLAPELNIVIEGFQTSTFSIILGVIVGLAVPVISSILPVFNGTRVRILEAMTDLGIGGNYGSGPLARLISVLPLPTTVRQGLSNVSTKKSRLAFTVITLSIAVGAFIGIFAVFDSLTSGINLFLDSFNVEIFVFPNEGRDPDEITAVLSENFMTEENNVFKSIEPGFQLQVEFEGYDPVVGVGGPPGIFAYGYDVNSENPAFNFEIDEGDPLDDSNYETGIIFSSLLANNMEKKIGDQVVMKVPGNSAELTIVGISEYPLDQVWIDWRTLATIAGYTVGAPTPNEYRTELVIEDYTGSLPDNKVSTIGLNDQFAGFITFTEGQFFSEQAPGVIISEAMAENGNYAVGDTLTLTATTDEGTSAEYPIVGIFEIPAPLRQDPSIPSDILGMDWQALAGLEGLSLEGKPRPQGYFVVTNLDDPTVDELDDVISDVNDVMLAAGIPAGAFNFVELVEQIRQAFLTFQIILQMVAFLIAIVGALGLLTTLSMSVFERQKEIGVMRSIGASSRTVALQFLTEGLVVGVIAWLIGLPLGYLIEVLLLNVTGFDETFPAVFPVTGAILGLIGMLVVTTLASLWPSLSAARKTVSDILRYQ